MRENLRSAGLVFVLVLRIFVFGYVGTALLALVGWGAIGIFLGWNWQSYVDMLRFLMWFYVATAIAMAAVSLIKWISVPILRAVAEICNIIADGIDDFDKKNKS